METTFTTAKVTIIDRIRGYFEMRRYRKHIAERRKVLDEMHAEKPKKPSYLIDENDIAY